jgi:membrane protease YdiL (CAAX protease family)
VRLAFGVIGANIVYQLFLAALVVGGQLQSDRALSLTLWGAFVFYGITLAVIVGPLFVLRPQWSRGDPWTAPLLGAEVGVLMAGVLSALGWAAAGHPLLDPFVREVVSEATVTRVLLAVATGVIVAPVVEELLFRGVVLEALRRRGPRVAIFVSSFLFALAHLRSLPYYTVMGALFGGLYWRRGLRASIAAHAAFNGSLTLLAVLVVLGPSHLFSANGVTVKAPAGWQLASVSTGVIDLALEGPGGSALLVRHSPLPPNTGVDLAHIASAYNTGTIPLPKDTTLVPGSSHTVTYPAGQGVELSITRHGHSGYVVLVPKGAELWEANVYTEGSRRAKHDYPGMLQSLTLPTLQ